MAGKQRTFRGVVRAMAVTVVLGAPVVAGSPPAGLGSEAESLGDRIGLRRGICAVLGLPETAEAGDVVQLAQESQLTVYFQSARAAEVAAVRKAAEAEGLLGTRVFADQGSWSRIHLADNLAGAVLVGPAAGGKVTDQEILRALHPEGRGLVGQKTLVKPFPEGIDFWSHPYHGPDNNPQSTDQRARAPYLTQFLAEPYFVPMPEVSVAAGGRVYRAFGHIAHKANQNAWLNTLICVNAFNGTILWKRPLPPGFMIHRNTMIATPDGLYLGDNRSCKRIDGRTGQVLDEITLPEGLADGPVWKWMALVDGVLYALVGGPETPIATQRSNVPGLGHWPWGMWAGHDYRDPRTSFGFGRTLVAIDPETHQIRWSHREPDYIDGRGVCMSRDRIFFYVPEKRLGALDARTGDPVWTTSDPEVLGAIGPHGRAQHYVTGYATSTYVKCTDDYLFFAGPQRPRMVVLSARDGRLLWQKEDGNFRLVLREDGIYAAGPQQRQPGVPQTSYKLAYDSGEVLARLPMRRACTRATGSVDSVFFRASGGTIRIDTATNQAKHIDPMRPPCQDGVIISAGNLYWGPWMCGCQLSLYGHIALTAAGGFNFRPGLDESRWERTAQEPEAVQPLEVRPGDWPTYGGDSARSMVTPGSLPARGVKRVWSAAVSPGSLPTAPVTAGELVFVASRTGAVRALRAADGRVRWETYTGGAVFFPPAVAQGRLLVGSGDGRVYAFEAATGRPLWRFRAAPADRLIPVYGKLLSTWPVAGGVVVHDGVVYAAAGIAHYDGTHVYALDVVTGQVKWYNDSSGSLSKAVDHGVSLQGELAVQEGELRFLGGGVHETARYDLETGRCLNAPYDAPNAVFPTAFYAYFPSYGKYLSLDHTFADGRSLVYDASYEGAQHGPLALLPAGAPKPPKRASRWPIRRQPNRKVVWEDATGRRFTAFVITDQVLLAAGQRPTSAGPKAFLAAIRVDDGSTLWRIDLPALVVKGGGAVNHQGQIFVTLEDGQLLCFQ